MSVVALVSESTEARHVIGWAGRFAAARGAELVVFYVSGATVTEDLMIPTDQDDPSPDSVRSTVDRAVENVVRTRRARKGRIPRHAVSLRRISNVDSISLTLSRLRVESPELLVVAGTPKRLTNGGGLARQVATKAPCDVVILYGGQDRSSKADQIVVGTTEGSHDKEAIELAVSTSNAVKGTVTAVCIEARVGEGAIEVGERTLRSMLRDLQLQESSRLKVKAILGDDRVAAMAEVAQQCDLLFVGANMEAKVPQLLEAIPNALVGVFRRAPRLGFSNGHMRVPELLPRLTPADYADLFEQLQTGSRWNSDFIVMLSLSAAISSLGLLQNSPAVVIGSMLLAPLMTPMIGMGLALNQGNGKLAYSCFRAIGRGFLAALGISALVGWITPGSDVTLEVLARTDPNILDLLIAFFSGIAAAYALARPSVAGTIAGVAIATALVPPVCSVGILLAYGHLPDAIGAMFLLVTNVLAIILAAAATFYAMGLRGLTGAAPRRFWVKHVLLGLSVCVLVLSVPLASSFVHQIHEGKAAPAALAVTNETREALLAHLDQMPDISLLFVGRAGVTRETEPVDVAIILSSTRPLSRSEGDKIVQLIRDTMQNPELSVKVDCVANGWTQKKD